MTEIPSSKTENKKWPLTKFGAGRCSAERDIKAGEQAHLRENFFYLVPNSGDTEIKGVFVPPLRGGGWGWIGNLDELIEKIVLAAISSQIHVLGDVLTLLK